MPDPRRNELARCLANIDQCLAKAEAIAADPEDELHGLMIGPHISPGFYSLSLGLFLSLTAQVARWRPKGTSGHKTDAKHLDRQIERDPLPNPLPI
jgi:hypothetical protein